MLIMKLLRRLANGKQTSRDSNPVYRGYNLFWDSEETNYET